jgi:hypothetical protein
LTTAGPGFGGQEKRRRAASNLAANPRSRYSLFQTIVVDNN